MEQQTGSKSGKEYVKAVYCHPAYLKYAEYIMWNAGLDEAQFGIKIARGTEEPLDESERGEWKSWLKAQHSEN